MRRDDLEPRQRDLRDIAKVILGLQPLAVVLTGGDPLFTSHLPAAIELLSGSVGIVLDTSGYTLTSQHIALFRKHGVTVRISLDSERPKVHEAQRPLSSRYPGFRRSGIGTLAAAIHALSACLDAGVPVAVQTVATKKTVNDLVSLGDKLYRLGVRSWRIFKVAPSAASMEGYTRLVGTHSDAGHVMNKHSLGSYRYNFQRVLSARGTNWGDEMAVQVTHNETPNSVILVSPDGRFMTESNVGARKVLVDQARPRAPRLSSIRSSIDMAGHARRYLNLTTPSDDARTARG
jgi:MoaA/NifB/PqqE/SkfB family radical SAM enzyme